MPDARDHTLAAVVGRKFYVLGGSEKGQLKGKDTVLILDLDDIDSSWTARAAKPPTPRVGLSATAVGNSVYTFGGEGNPKSPLIYLFNNTEVYHVESDN
jgi:N-acetylneuraminic acid mutarotase